MRKTLIFLFMFILLATNVIASEFIVLQIPNSSGVSGGGGTFTCHDSVKGRVSNIVNLPTKMYYDGIFMSLTELCNGSSASINTWATCCEAGGYFGYYNYKTVMTYTGGGARTYNFLELGASEVFVVFIGPGANGGNGMLDTGSGPGGPGGAGGGIIGYYYNGDVNSITLNPPYVTFGSTTLTAAAGCVRGASGPGVVTISTCGGQGSNGGSGNAGGSIVGGWHDIGRGGVSGVSGGVSSNVGSAGANGGWGAGGGGGGSAWWIGGNGGAGGVGGGGGGGGGSNNHTGVGGSGGPGQLIIFWNPQS